MKKRIGKGTTEPRSQEQVEGRTWKEPRKEGIAKAERTTEPTGKPTSLHTKDKNLSLVQLKIMEVGARTNQPTLGTKPPN